MFRNLTVTYTVGRLKKPRVLFISLLLSAVGTLLSACFQNESSEIMLSFQVKFNGEVSDCLPDGIDTLSFYLADPKANETTKVVFAGEGVNPRGGTNPI